MSKSLIAMWIGIAMLALTWIVPPLKAGMLRHLLKKLNAFDLDPNRPPVVDWSNVAAIDATIGVLTAAAMIVFARSNDNNKG